MDQTNKEFLRWLANRLIFKHGYSQNDPIIIQLNELIAKNFMDLQDDELDKILSKYYIGFFLEKTEDIKIGYSNEERDEIRSYAKSLIFDVINKNIPETILQ